MSQIINVSIDFNKLKSLSKVQGKNGAEYINLTVMLNDQKDKFGNDASVSVSQTKEEREAKTPKTYVGNGKIVFNSNSNPF